MTVMDLRFFKSVIILINTKINFNIYFSSGVNSVTSTAPMLSPFNVYVKSLFKKKSLTSLFNFFF